MDHKFTTVNDTILKQYLLSPDDWYLVQHVKNIWEVASCLFACCAHQRQVVKVAKPNNQLANKLTVQSTRAIIPEATILVVLSDPLLIACNGGCLQLSWVTQHTVLHRQVGVLITQVLRCNYVRQGYFEENIPSRKSGRPLAALCTMAVQYMA